MTKSAIVLAALAIAAPVYGGAAKATDEGLYAGQTTFNAAHAPRHGGPNEDSFVVTRDDRGVVACYQGTYYPARYRVDPQGRRVRGANTSIASTSGNQYVARRNASVYLETRTRIKEDYVSLRRVSCR